MNFHRLTDRLGALADAMVGWRPDAIMIGGGFCVAYGAWLVYQPAGFIVGGLLALAAGWIDARSAK